jgi:4-hydroxy-tetrahydrodipicolinate synthase
MHEMCIFALRGKADEANKINETLEGLHKKLFIESNPIPVKWVLNKLGLIHPGIRLPMTWLAQSFEEELLNTMKQAGIV